MIDARFKRPRLLQRLIGAATLDLLTAAFLAIVAVAAAIMPVPAAAASADTMVRGDWYFRESLSAIRDWEAILTRWEQEAPPRARVPVFPVPIDGGVVDWPNPIPLLLLAAEDRHLRERVRWVEGKIEIEHSRPRGGVERERFAPGQPIVGYKHPGGGGKDQWYHVYERKFDELTTFVAKPSPLAVQLPSPLDLKRGRGEVPVTLRNVTSRTLLIELSLELDTPQKSRESVRHFDHPGRSGKPPGQPADGTGRRRRCAVRAQDRRGR